MVHAQYVVVEMPVDIAARSSRMRILVDCDNNTRLRSARARRYARLRKMSASQRGLRVSRHHCRSPSKSSTVVFGMRANDAESSSRA